MKRMLVFRLGHKRVNVFYTNVWRALVKKYVKK